MDTAETTITNGDYDIPANSMGPLSDQLTYQKRKKHTYIHFAMNSRWIMQLTCLLLLCVEMVHGRCANSCSGHGTCNLNVCVCFTGWNGGAADCSMRKYHLSLMTN